MRPHVAALYAFARQADDVADEGTFTAKERLARLDEFGQRLVACVAETHPRLDTPDDRLFAALGHSIRACHLPPPLFAALLSAFAQDVVKTRYETWTERGRLLPSIGQSGRPARPAHCRLRRSATR